MSNTLEETNAKASIWQQLRSNKIAVISSYTIAKSVVGAFFMVLVSYEPFRFIIKKWSLYFPIVNLQNFLEDFVFILLISIDTILFCFLIKNLIKETNKKTNWFLAFGFLITPFLFKTFIFILTGMMFSIGIKEFQNEINYIFSDSIVLIPTLFVLIFKVSLCYVLLNWFEQKKGSYSLFKIDVRHFLWFFIPTSGYVYFILKYLIYFVTNYSDHIANLKYLSRAWWGSIFSMPIFAFGLFFLLLTLMSRLKVNLELVKKSNINYLAIFTFGIISPLLLFFFENQVFQFITFILNFLIYYCDKI